MAQEPITTVLGEFFWTHAPEGKPFRRDDAIRLAIALATTYETALLALLNDKKVRKVLARGVKRKH